MAREDIQLAFDIELQTRQLMQRMAAFDRTVQNTSKSLNSVALQAKIFGRKHEEAAKQAESAMDSYQNAILEQTAKVKAAREDLAKAVGKAEIESAKATITAAESQAKFVISNARDAANASIKEAQRTAKEVKAALKSGETMDFGNFAASFTKSFEQETDWDKFRDTISDELKSGLEEGFDSFKGKDLSGIIKGSGKFASGLLKGIGGIGGAGVTKGGAALQRMGDRVKEGGGGIQMAKDLAKSIKAQGGLGGVAKKGIGAAGGAIKGGAIKGLEGIKSLGSLGGMMKGVGGLMKSLGPLIGTLAKMGPLLSASAAIFAGIVKVALDAEAAAKGMNKEILESAGSADMLYSSQTKGLSGFNKAQAAFKNLDSVLDDIRYEATDIKKNLKYGMKAEDVINVTKAFTQQGVTLTSLEQAFKNAGDAAESSQAQIQSYGDVARMGMVYSRLFGVSLNEITEMQSEMFTEMGQSLSGIQLTFASMTKDAAESGIASNKFFNIIRGVSQDLSLYTTRVGQAAQMLKLLGKAMNPRDAQKFMQMAAKGFKEMSEEDRLRTTLLAGEGKVREVAAKDLERKGKFMAAELKSQLGGATDMSQEAIEALIKEARGGSKKATEDLKAMFEKMPDAAKGAMRGTLSEMTMDTNALKKGGTMGAAEAAGNLSLGAVTEVKKAALRRFGGNKKLSEMTGVEAFAARKATGTSLDEFRGLAKLEGAVDDQKDVMIKMLKLSKKDTNLLTKEEKEQLDANKGLLTKMDALKLNSEDAIKAAEDDDILSSMEQSQQDALAAANEQKDYAAETAKATSSISDKMEAIIEGIFEFLYVALKDIFRDLNEFIDMMANLPGLSGKGRKGSEEKDVKNALREGQTEANAKVMQSLRAGIAKEGPGDTKTKMIDVLGPALQKGMEQETAERKKELFAGSLAAEEKKRGGKLAGNDLEAFKKTFEEGYSKLSAQQKLGGKQQSDLQVIGRTLDPAKLKEVAGMTGMDPKKLEAFNKAIDEGRGILGAGDAAGFSEKDFQAIMAKSVWAMTPEQLAKTMPNLQTVQAGTEGRKRGGAEEAKPPAPSPPPGAPTPTGQAAAAQRSQAPGNAGAATGATAAAATPATPAGPPPPPVAPAGAPVAAPVATPSATSPAVDASKVLQETKQSIEDGSAYTVKNLQDLWNAMRVKGIKIDKSMTIEQHFKKAIEEGSLAAIRKGLFEYAMYSTDDPAKLLDKMQKAGFSEVGAMATAYKDDPKNAEYVHKANAEGGIVTSVSGGIAQVQKIPMGEGLASIGKGERIIPAGAGGGGGGNNPIQINVNGIGGQDLANFLKVKMAEAIYEYKRREKLT